MTSVYPSSAAQPYNYSPIDEAFSVNVSDLIHKAKHKQRAEQTSADI